MIIQLAHIDIFAKEILDKIKVLGVQGKATVVFLSGDLGSGKTTTTKAIAKELGIQEDITSPTFVILKRYDIDQSVLGRRFLNLIHIDAYRLKSYEELQKIKFEEYLMDEKNLILIEWPEMVENEKLVADVSLRFEHGEKEGERVVEII
jgi:tRNA threonylcarbamoyladenosine biosynthesis protein TsaE